MLWRHLKVGDAPVDRYAHFPVGHERRQTTHEGGRGDYVERRNRLRQRREHLGNRNQVWNRGSLTQT